MKSILIDGSVLEGGGQILRNSISLSALLGKPVSIRKIRFARTPPGLKNQHRTGLHLAAEIASARLTGATNGSTDIEFVPGRICLPGTFTADSITAGSTTLLLQIALPLLLFAPSSVAACTSGSAPTPTLAPAPVQRSELILKGGTNATQAPQIDYTQHVFLPFFHRHFLPSSPSPSPSSLSSSPKPPCIDLQIIRRGYFPKGGGEVRVHVTPVSRLHGFSLMNRGRVLRVGGIAHFAGLPMGVGREMVVGARRRLARVDELGDHEGVNGGEGGEGGGEGKGPRMAIEYKRERNEDTKGAGSGIVLWAELEGGGVVGGSAVGRKGVDPARVGAEAAEELVRGLEAGGCVDEWLQDQIVIFMALAEGRSEVRCGRGGLALHTQTAIWVAEQLSDAKFEVEEDSTGHTVIRCQGIGYTARQ
ncbi:RNA 3'-terminal phosphate cyclase [Hypsizygus marmoreus]|uniref:RNA 3'-terminal phosphate cyclase n=1 Tax=Hypsizygus marmoreus TaxID=39966 RepID=A0A369JP94_HYPMA|nr:RNA 3'-terminal phosphate cyclase [Hypsizygus marmoreus]